MKKEKMTFFRSHEKVMWQSSSNAAIAKNTPEVFYFLKKDLISNITDLVFSMSHEYNLLLKSRMAFFWK